MSAFLVAILVAITLLYGCCVNISNIQVRRDINGELMDTHDGNIEQWEAGGLYYSYSMGYQNCKLETGAIPPQDCPGIYKPFGACGFRTDHALRVYSSHNLQNWTLVSENALPESSRPYGIYFRPKVIRHPRTKTYLLWINYLMNSSSTETPLSAYPDASLLVASSSSPGGPFEVVTEKVMLNQTGAGDFDLMVDKNAPHAAYIAYDAWGNDHAVLIEQLNPSFTDTLTGGSPTEPLSPTNNEAPVLFQRGSYYYLLYGHTCCFCREGGGVAVMVASHPLGPWLSLDLELNPVSEGSLYHTIPSQNSFVFEAALADGTTQYVFAGDLWTSAADGLKSHDLQYWQPLVFNDSVTPPTINPFVWQDWIELKL